ncbi:MAG: PIG-L deacetylase family protein [Gammaproteobacteria bacterium]|nr:MAG: PIG-L deacetylase family protein [Gammaproteobacteria bacterium]
MIGFEPGGAQAVRSILLLGAHCDDIEIGCGGTLLRMAAAYPQAGFLWVTLSGDAARAAETRAAAKRLLIGAGSLTVLCETFRGSYFPYDGARIKDYFESLKARVQPDLIFTHHGGDLHQDHRVTSELTWNTFRNHMILEYEIPKYDGDLGRPNCYVPLSAADLATKNRILSECFPSQRGRGWFTTETFTGLARLRGIECNAPDGYAEAFHARKLVMGLGRP